MSDFLADLNAQADDANRDAAQEYRDAADPLPDHDSHGWRLACGLGGYDGGDD